MRLDSIKQAEGIIEQPSPGRKWVTTILKTAVSVGLLIFLFSKVDMVRVGESFRHVHPGVFFLSALAYLVLQSVNIFRWLVMIRVLGYRQSFGRLSTFYFTGYFFNLFLPTSIGGDIGRCYYLAENPRDIPRAFTTILADRASGMVALMCIGTFALLIGPEVRIPDSMAWVTMGGTAALLAGVVLPFLFPRFFRRFTVPFRYWEKPVSLGAALILSFIIQLSIVGVNILIGLSLGVDIPSLYYFVFVPLVTIAGMIPISLNGLGVREGAYVYFLTQAGVSDADSLVFGLIWLILVLIISGIGGGVWVVTSRTQSSAKA